jgi:hypothetical protein
MPDYDTQIAPHAEGCWVKGSENRRARPVVRAGTLGTLSAYSSPNAFDLPTNQRGLARARRVKFSRGIFIAACLGLGFVGLGFDLLARYTNTPGLAVVAPAVWPAESRLPMPAGRPMLVVFAHPRCPCSRASVAELAELMAGCTGRVTTRVLFYKPKDSPEDWVLTDTWRSAFAIPGVVVAEDKEGVEAKRFGAKTSGSVVLYDATGRLLFSGGITAARGERGANDGSRAILALLEKSSAPEKSPVFGCPIFERNSRCTVENVPCPR